MKFRQIKASTLLLVIVCIPQWIFAKKQTNFIIILMDDMGYGDVCPNGSMGYEMPNLNRMIHEGMHLTHFYAPQAVSGASRAGILTGCYPNRIGMSGAPFPGAKHGIHKDEMTIAELLKQKGYLQPVIIQYFASNKSEIWS